MVDFDVVGVKIYSENVLQAGTLWFKSHSKLVLAPDRERHHIPTSLTIITNKIRIDDTAEITYDLDGLPGFDPDTPAPPQSAVVGNGPDGASSPGEGPYPRAKNGGDGGQGQSGKNAISGMHAPVLEIFVGQVDQDNLDALTINFRGQEGGKGGKGGNGGNGGNGQKGAAATSSDSWYDGNECTREPGRGGNGGKGGSAGYPGRGGAGGNGGIIKVFTRAPSSVGGWIYIFDGGKGGPAGDPGKQGNGGAGGAQGDRDSEDACPVRSEYRGTDGPLGQSMNEIDPDWQKNYRGNDGVVGEVEIIEIMGVPS
jgi:hypothetical protein